MIPINNIVNKIKRTEKFKYYKNNDTIIVNDTLYYIDIEFIHNKLSVEVQSEKDMGWNHPVGTYQSMYNPENTPQDKEFNNALRLARKIEEEILAEVKERTKKEYVNMWCQYCEGITGHYRDRYNKWVCSR